VKALVVTRRGTHITEWDSTFWERVDQALEAVQRISSPTVCIVVSDEETLNTISPASPTPAPGNALRNRSSESSGC
jgi:hypothetical protein